MIVHRFIPASPKHGAKTACGIRLHADDHHQTSVMALDGGLIRVSGKGEQFDCKRCRSVLELHHRKEAVRP